jgi:hypothetical protein
MIPSALLFGSIRCLECRSEALGHAQFSWGALSELEFTDSCPYRIGDAVRWTPEQPTTFRDQSFPAELPSVVVCGDPRASTIDIGCYLLWRNTGWQECPTCKYRAEDVGILVDFTGIIHIVENVFVSMEPVHARNWRADIIDPEALL